MSLSNSVFRETISACSKLHDDHALECISLYFSQANAMRSLTEILIRSMAIHVVAMASYGHLLSMQGLTKSQSPAYYLLPLVFFFFFPELPAIQFLFRIGRVCSQLTTKRGASYRYCVSACLGCHVMVSGVIYPLEDIDPSSLSLQKKPRNLVWIGRQFLLMLLLAQYVASAAILYRVFVVFTELENVYDPPDRRNLEVIFGGVVSVLNNIAINILNYDYIYTPLPESAELSHIEASSTLGRPNGALASNEQLSPNIDDDRLVRTRTERFFLYVSSKNTSFTDWLAESLSARTQTEIEHALIAQRVFELLIFVVQDSRGTVSLTSFYCNKESEYAIAMRMCDYTILRASKSLLHYMRRGLSPFSSYLLPGSSLYIFFYVIIARIVLADLLRFAIWCTPSNFSDKISIVMCTVRGRTIITFPLVVTSILFNIGIRLAYYCKYSGAVFRYESRDFGNDDWGRLYDSITRFKDPWYDSMYVL
jgi:hypothetical protein